MSLFSDLYRYVRTLLGDIYPVPAYSNDQLDMGISLALLQEAPLFNDAGGDVITPDVSAPVDKLRISLRAAVALLRPAADEGSYRTPMLSVSTHSSLGYLELKAALQQLVDGGANAVMGDNEFDQAFNGITTVPALLARFGITSSTLVNWGNNQTVYPNG